MLTVLEKKKLKDLLFSEKFSITSESKDWFYSVKAHYVLLKSEHFEICSTETERDSEVSLQICVYFINKVTEIDITNMFDVQEIVDIINFTRKQQAELFLKAKEEKREKEENILKKFIKKFK